MEGAETLTASASDTSKHSSRYVRPPQQQSKAHQGKVTQNSQVQQTETMRNSNRQDRQHPLPDTRYRHTTIDIDKQARRSQGTRGSRDGPSKGVVERNRNRG